MRDRDGHAVGSLTKTDFELRDDGKPQTILEFSVNPAGLIVPSTVAAIAAIPASEPSQQQPLSASRQAAIPDRFLAYVFDDVHTDIADLIRAREEATKHLGRVLEPAIRVGVFTISGQTLLDFTGDLAQVRKTIESIRRFSADERFADCPPLNYYWADLILKNDSEAMGAGVIETMDCMRLGPRERPVAERIVRTSALSWVARGQYESGLGLKTLDDVVRRLSVMPGSRIIVYVSSGFLVDKDLRFTQVRVFENAIKADVVINSLDARGLYTVTPGGRADNPVRSSSEVVVNFRERMNRELPLATTNVMAEFAGATGGTFIWNSNDYQAGYEELAGVPKFTYILWFAPAVRNDGKYHKLKVTLKNGKGLKLSARTGYYAPAPK